MIDKEMAEVHGSLFNAISLVQMGPIGFSPTRRPSPSLEAQQTPSNPTFIKENRMQYFTVKQFANQLQVSEKTVRRMLDRDELKSKRVGRLIRIPEIELEMKPTVTLPWRP